MNRVLGLIALTLIFLLPGVLAASSSNFPVDGPIPMSCADLSDLSTLVGGNTPNSANGYGAVDICTNCYPCGYDDGICPEDFYSGTSQGSCFAWP